MRLNAIGAGSFDQRVQLRACLRASDRAREERKLWSNEDDTCFPYNFPYEVETFE
jgi:hypothetical protein